MMDATTRMALSAMISNAAGFSFPESHSADLDRGVRNACDELQISDPDQFVHRVLTRSSDPHLLECLINHLTIGETYFFGKNLCWTPLPGSCSRRLKKSERQGEDSEHLVCRVLYR